MTHRHAWPIGAYTSTLPLLVIFVWKVWSPANTDRELCDAKSAQMTCIFVWRCVFEVLSCRVDMFVPHNRRRRSLASVVQLTTSDIIETCTPLMQTNTSFNLFSSFSSFFAVLFKTTAEISCDDVTCHTLPVWRDVFNHLTLRETARAWHISITSSEVTSSACFRLTKSTKKNSKNDEE